MLPLAVSGLLVIGAVVAAAILLVVLLLRSEDRAQAEQREDSDR